MTKDQALEQLKFHTGRHPDVDSPRWRNGFIPSLRPYGGLNRSAFDNLMECLNVLKDGIKRDETLDKELVLELWTLCHYSKAWGTDAEGMLRRNNLITDADLKLLGDWINQISYKISLWLEGLEDED